MGWPCDLWGVTQPRWLTWSATLRLTLSDLVPGPLGGGYSVFLCVIMFNVLLRDLFPWNQIFFSDL